jgi:hypothetical protein
MKRDDLFSHGLIIGCLLMAGVVIVAYAVYYAWGMVA